MALKRRQWYNLPNEQKREYHMRTGKTVSMKAKRIMISHSGTHYIETADGNKLIVAPASWDFISIKAEDWDVL